MTLVLVPTNRNVIGANEIIAGASTRAMHFADSVALYHWCFARGTVLVPAYSPEEAGIISGGGNATFYYYAKPNAPIWNRIWFIWASSTSSTAVGSLRVSASGGGSTQTTSVPYGRISAPIAYVQPLTIRLSAADGFYLLLEALTVGITINSIACFEIPRMSLIDGDVTDAGVNPIEFLPARPMQGNTGIYSVEKIIDGTFAQRGTLFAWSVPNASAITTTSSTYSRAIRLKVPLLARAINLSNSTKKAVPFSRLTLAARMQATSGSANVQINSESLDWVASLISTGYAWATVSFDATAEDMQSTDGRRPYTAPAWSDCEITFASGTNGQTTSVTAIMVYEG